MSKEKKERLISDKSGFLEVDNSKIYWEYFGKGDKEVLCLLNGIAMYTKSWFSFLPLVLEEYDVLLYDYLGQGESTSEDVPYSIVSFCDYLTQIIDELGIEKVHIAGISYGGFVALNYAQLYQDRVHTCCVSGALLEREILYDINKDNSILILQDAPFHVFTSILYGSIFGEDFVKNVRPLFDTMRDKLFNRYKDRMHSLVRLIETQNDYFNFIDDNLDKYKEVKVPTLVMCGEHDTLIPPWIQIKICNILPNSKFILVPNSGHVVYLEQSNTFFGKLKELMKTKSIDGIE